MELYQDIYGTNSIETAAVKGSNVRIEYLMHQYPWFTREQIAEAVEKENHHLGKILTTLDKRSGSYPELFGF